MDTGERVHWSFRIWWEGLICLNKKQKRSDEVIKTVGIQHGTTTLETVWQFSYEGKYTFLEE